MHYTQDAEAHLEERDDETDYRVTAESAGEDLIHAALVQERLDEHDQAPRDAVVDQLRGLLVRRLGIGLALSFEFFRGARFDPVIIPRRVLLEEVPHAHGSLNTALLVHAQVD